LFPSAPNLASNGSSRDGGGHDDGIALHPEAGRTAPKL
jgi:hypothetical protein